MSPGEYYALRSAQARQVGQAPEVLRRDLLATALQAREAAQAHTVRDVLDAAGQLRPLSATLRRKIIPDVTLDEVRTILTQVTGPVLSDIIHE